MTTTTRKRRDDVSPPPRAKRVKLNLRTPPLSSDGMGFVALKRLEIQGVRSFPPTMSQTIVFEEPLTVLEGPNGVGKTTVTEALRYATTGTLPPGPGGLAARQHTFVHQPSGTVLPWPEPSQATVRLTFRNTRGETITVTRKVTLTMRDNLTMQAKTHPVRITIEPAGGGEKAKRTVPSKEIAAVMAEHLNVSAAILDSVLFVHQSEADWPLSSAQELKDRIDKILETNVQTKALEEFGKYRKQCERDVSKLEVELAKWAEAVQTKQRTQLRLHELEGEARSAKQQLTTLHQEANALEIKVSQAQTKANEANVAPTMRPLLRNIETVVKAYRSGGGGGGEDVANEVVKDAEVLSFLPALQAEQEALQQRVGVLAARRQPLDTAFATLKTDSTKAHEHATQATARYEMLEEKVERLRQQLSGVEDLPALLPKLARLDERIQCSYAEEAQRARLQDATKRLATLESAVVAQRARVESSEQTLVALGSQDTLDVQIKTINAHVQAFHEAKARGTVARDAQAMLEKAASTCPVCVQPLDGSHRTTLLQKYHTDVQHIPRDAVLQDHNRHLKQLRENRLTWLSTHQSLSQLRTTLESVVLERDAEAKQVAVLRAGLRDVPSESEVAALRTTQQQLSQQRRLWHEFERVSKEFDVLHVEHDAKRAAATTCSVALGEAREALVECDKEMSEVAKQAHVFRQLVQAEHDLETLETCVAKLSTESSSQPPVLQSGEVASVSGMVVHIATRLRQYETRYTQLAQDQTEASQFLQQSNEALARVNQHYHEQRGRHEALAQQCNALQTQLEDAHYREADLNYARLNKQIAMYARAVDDMKRYHRARADAIVRYHQETMTEINRILDELWKQSYQGDDIETISIVSERRKNTHIYDYRVVMQMAGASESQTKDMRAYASRGQQVLAALMIRFAFARAFSLHTNLLVLDEPTTNLDAEHVHMLASTLNRIIALHPKGTLQLVVITHNRAFVEQLCKSQHADYYYRLSRTPYTTIDKQPIRTL